MIVKIQQSISSTDQSKKVLIYNKKKTFLLQLDHTDSPEMVDSLVKVLDGQDKAYFNVIVQNQELAIQSIVTKPQGW